MYNLMNSSRFVLLIIGLLMITTACSNESETEANAEQSNNKDFAISHMFPSSSSTETDIVQYFGSKVEETTNGEISITSYPGNQLAEADEHYEAAANAVVDMGYGVQSYRPGQFPLTTVMELPFITGTGVEGSQILWQLYEEFPELQDEYQDVELLWLATTDPGQLYTIGKQVKKPEDLQGMTIRTSSPEVSVWLKEMGASPVSMPFSDVYEALEKGVVDGTMGPYHSLIDFSLIDVIDYVTVGNFYNSAMYGVMNQNEWDSLSTDNQQAIDKLKGEHMAELNGEVYDTTAEKAIEATEEAGVEFYELSEKELEDWAEVMQPAIDNWIEDKEGQGLPGQEVYDRAAELSSEIEE